MLESMMLSFTQIQVDDDAIHDIYDLISKCGQDMFVNQGLVHWRTPYPIDCIRRDCLDHAVYLVKQGERSVATFQICPDEKGALISKVAVDPECAGAGIGRRCMQFAEEQCRKKGISLMHLDVYDKSEKAIRFYLNNGFSVVGSAPTRYFTVLLMEKLVV